MIKSFTILINTLNNSSLIIRLKPTIKIWNYCLEFRDGGLGISISPLFKAWLIKLRRSQQNHIKFNIRTYTDILLFLTISLFLIKLIQLRMVAMVEVDLQYNHQQVGPMTLLRMMTIRKRIPATIQRRISCRTSPRTSGIGIILSDWDSVPLFE